MLRRSLPLSKFVHNKKVGHGHRPLGLNKNQFLKMRSRPGRKVWRHNTAFDNADVSVNVIGDVASSSDIVNRRQQQQQQQQYDQQGGRTIDNQFGDGDGEMYDHQDDPSFMMNRQQGGFSDETVVEDGENYGGSDESDHGDDNFYMDHTQYQPSPHRRGQEASQQQMMTKSEERQKLREINRGLSTPRRNPYNTLSGFNANALYDQNYQLQQQQQNENNNNSQGELANFGDENGNNNLEKFNMKIGKDTAMSLHTDPNTINTEEDMDYQSITHGAFDSKTRKTQVVIPKHINNLYSKITRWSNELKQRQPANSTSTRPGTTVDVLDGDNEDNFSLDTRTGTIDNPSPEAVKANPLLAKHAMDRAKEKLQYGALMDAYESDRFAKENKLAVAGAKFEKSFMNWQGVKILENVPQQQMEDTRQSKGSLIMHNPTAFKIPKMNHDHCPGCGACLQDEKETEFGFCYPGDIEQYILTHQSVFAARQDYATRMYELMTHWEKHGKRVGEEWLDFMTQEEFNAVYRFVSRPFVCRRCVNLENYGVTTNTMVMSAPDFKEKLTALREKKCVVVLVVDLTDFPGSMVPDLPGLISMNNPVIIVPNKLDCVNPVSFDYKGRNAEKLQLRLGYGFLKRWVTEQAVQFRLPSNQIKAVVPVSAKKGWGIAELVEQIERLSNLNLAKPTAPVPTYFVGVSNVGKSSVINAIAHHLYKPGPPLPSSKKVYFTYINDKTGAEEIGSRWVTDKKMYNAEMQMINSRMEKRHTKLVTTSPLPGTTINAVAVKISLAGENGDEKNSKYSGISKKNHSFLFDTPGLHPVWQETSPLTIRDQVKCLINKRYNPNGRVLTQGFTLFFGGIACIDVVKANCDIFFMTYHSIHVTTASCETERSDAYWREHAGMKLNPPGSRATLIDNENSQTLSPLGDLGKDSTIARISTSLCVKKSYLFECYENHFKRPKADIYFCGVGWVSFYTSEPADIVLRVRTLPGIVHGVRQPLRKRDMTRFRKWPRLPDSQRVLTAASKRKVEDVIELVDGPKDADLSKPPLIEVAKTNPLSAAMGIDRQKKNQHVDYDRENVDDQEGGQMKKKKSQQQQKQQEQETASSMMRNILKQEASSSPFDFIMQQLNKQGKIGGGEN